MNDWSSLTFHARLAMSLLSLLILGMVCLSMCFSATFILRHRSRSEWKDRLSVLCSTPWKWFDAFILIAVLLIASSIPDWGGGLLRRLAEGLPSVLSWVREIPGYIAGTFLMQVCGLFTLVLLARIRSVSLPRIRLSRLLRCLGQAVAAWFLIVPTIWLLNFLWQLVLVVFGYATEFQASIQFILNVENPHVRILFLVFAIVVAPVVEEGLFRGILLPLCSRQWGALAGILISSLIFTLLHSHMGTSVALFVLSVGLSLAYAYTRTIVVPILLHIFFNAFNLLLVWALTQAGML